MADIFCAHFTLVGSGLNIPVVSHLSKHESLFQVALARFELVSAVRYLLALSMKYYSFSPFSSMDFTTWILRKSAKVMRRHSQSEDQSREVILWSSGIGRMSNPLVLTDCNKL